MGRFGLAVSWCLRRVVALKRQQAKAVVAKGNWQAVKAIKNLFGDGPKRQRFRRPLGGNFSGGNSSNFLSAGTPS